MALCKMLCMCRFLSLWPCTMAAPSPCMSSNRMQSCLLYALALLVQLSYCTPVWATTGVVTAGVKVCAVMCSLYKHTRGGCCQGSGLTSGAASS